MLSNMWMQRPQYLVDIHTDSNIWGVVFVFECVVLSKQITQNGKLLILTTKINDETV